MKYGFYVSGNAGRVKLFLKEKFMIENIAFILIDNTDNQELADLCEKMKIPLCQYSYLQLGFKGKEQNQFISNKLLELLENTKSEYCFIFGGRILIGDLLLRYKNRLINFHPSILPAFKGKNAIDQALTANVLLLGNTAHFIDEQLDNGATIMQSIIPAQQFNGYDSVMDLQIPMLKQLILWLDNKRMTVKNGKIIIKNAKYNVDTFIPNLEI
jgi:phosphoribosylglycinamide formyltransferase-1